MIISFEEKFEQFDDVVFSYYIKTTKNEYRLAKTFVGGLDEDRNEFLEGSAFCVIDLYETTANNHETIKTINAYFQERGDDCETFDDLVFVSAPATRRGFSVKNYSSYDDSENDFKKVLEMIAAEDLTAEEIAERKKLFDLMCVDFSAMAEHGDDENSVFFEVLTANPGIISNYKQVYIN